ncbi:MAG: PRC-barrel domain-containing protein [Cyanobacteria bacterium J06554_1]
MADESVLRRGALFGRLVLDYNTTNELGLVDDLLVDLAQGQVVGLLCKGALWQRQRPAYSWEHVTNIGKDSIVIHAPGAEMPNAAAQPMVGLEVWTDTGNCVGQIVDYRFERQGIVIQYLFAQSDQPGLYGLAPDAIISAGRKRIMVSALSVEQAAYFADEAPPDQQDWQIAAQTTAQSLADQVQQRAQGLSDYAQERWLTEDLNQQLQSTTRQLQDRTQGLRSQFNQQVSKAKERLSPLNKALENTLENTFDKFSDQTDPPAIDVDSFEVWEDDD